MRLSVKNSSNVICPRYLMLDDRCRACGAKAFSLPLHRFLSQPDNPCSKTEPAAAAIAVVLMGKARSRLLAEANSYGWKYDYF